MKVLFESRHPDAPTLRQLSMMRARFLLRRLVWLVPTVKVRMSEAHGRRQDTDKHCRVEVQTQGRDAIVVHTRASSWREALDGALSLAARLLLRASRRIHGSRVRRRPAIDFRG
jgi:hypothetical protein